jgi:hypothetical protein
MNEYHWLEDMKRQRVRKGIMHPKSIPFARKKKQQNQTKGVSLQSYTTAHAGCGIW